MVSVMWRPDSLGVLAANTPAASSQRPASTRSSTTITTTQLSMTVAAAQTATSHPGCEVAWGKAVEPGRGCAAEVGHGGLRVASGGDKADQSRGGESSSGHSP